MASGCRLSNHARQEGRQYTLEKMIQLKRQKYCHLTCIASICLGETSSGRLSLKPVFSWKRVALIELWNARSSSENVPLQAPFSAKSLHLFFYHKHRCDHLITAGLLVCRIILAGVFYCGKKFFIRIFFPQLLQSKKMKMSADCLKPDNVGLLSFNCKNKQPWHWLL